MLTSSSSNLSDNLHDPATVLQRPTSAKTPDVSHILTSVFGEAFTKDVLTTDIIKNLTVSSDVDDEYHKRYVQRLKDAQLVKEKRLQEYAMLEKHIMEARAKALAYEERENEKRNRVCDDPDKLGIPSAKSYFSYCLDDTLLKEHGLLVPSDYYYRIKQPHVPMPRGEIPASHLRQTMSSRSRSNPSSYKPLPSLNATARIPCIDDIEELHKSGSELSDDIRSISSADEYENDKDEKEYKKPFWKDTMRQEERVGNKEALKAFDRRTRFLPNPRLESMRVAQIIDNPDVVFEVFPKQISFEKYVTGKVYEGSFEVRNIGKIAHQVRVLPPKTQYFSLSLGQFPNRQSVIAPGLSALFNIKFAPDSLCAFEDELVIECSNGSKIKLPIVAQRESPKLTIGGMLDCGNSLVGQIKVCRYLIQNEGGDGRFVIMPKTSWPATNFKTNVSASSLSLYPFEIQPSIFELRKGDAFALEIVFKPPDTRKYEQDIVIACDNCTTIDMKIIGQGELAQVDFVGEDSINDPSTETMLSIDEYKDISSSKIIRFPTLNPSVFTTKRFAIQNKTSTPIDYSWTIYKPILEDNLFNEMKMKNINYSPEKDSFTFSIAPKQGTLDRNEVKYFEVVFSPLKVGTYNNVAHLILHGIPEINTQMLLDTNESIHKNSLSKDDTNTVDFVSNVVELRGVCEPFEFTLDPPAIYVPGQIFMHSTTRKAFRLINMSICPIKFSWKQVLTKQHVLQVEPSFGEIAPKSYALMDVLVTGAEPGRIVDDIACHVEHSDDPVYLHVEADIKGPEVRIHEAAVDFGLVKIGLVSKTYVTLENISNLPLNYNIVCADKENFKFQPNGWMTPLETKKIEIAFAPKEEAILTTLFEINIENGTSLKFNCYAQAQRPKASFFQSEMFIEELYLNIEKTIPVKMQNHAAINAEFVWGDSVEGANSSDCEISIAPRSGVLKPKGTTECSLKIKVRKLGELTDLRIPCFIQEMPEPIFLNLKSFVKGIAVSYHFSDSGNLIEKEKTSTIEFSSHRATMINFGEAKVNQDIERYLYLRNDSAIETKLSFSIKTFKAIDTSIQHHTNFIDPFKVQTKLSQRFKLKDNQLGVGFAPESPEVILAPFATRCLKLIGILEMWGKYEDTLVIDIDGLCFQHHIPISINVVDTPIKLFTGKVNEGENEQVSMLRFGSQIQGCGVITRKLKIQNTSWLPIELDWKVYLVDSNDHKLIDMNVLFDHSNASDTPRSFPDENADMSQQGDYETVKKPSDKTNPENGLDDDVISVNSSNWNEDNKFVKNVVPQSAATTSNDYSEAYIYTERIPLIKIKLTHHYGEPVSKENPVFLLNKYEMHLKPRDRSCIEVTFNTDIKKCQAYEAVFVGYFKLDQKYLSGPGFERKIGFNKDPIIFKATGKLDAPNLQVEYNEDLRFDLSVGDLINPFEKTIKPMEFYENQFTLLNSSLSPINFTMNINEPFALSNNSMNESSRNLTLRPRTKQQVDVKFKFNLALLSQKHRLAFEINRNQNPESQYENQYFLLKDEVKISFVNDMVSQAVPLSARIFIPELRINKTKLDFGRSLVGQERCQQLVLNNPSNSSLLWQLKIDNDTLNTFSTDLQSGYLEANIIYISKSEQVVNVFFKARHSEVYNAKIVIKVEPFSMMRPLVVDLRGAGTYDQKAEAIFNV